MIAPTVGRVVWYWPSGPKEGEQPHAAIVAHVHNDRLVALGVFSPNGVSYGVPTVDLLQDDDIPTPGAACAQWMPYQKGQAAKTEALEKELGNDRRS